MADALSDSEVTPTSASANLHTKPAGGEVVGAGKILEVEARALKEAEVPKAIIEHIEADDRAQHMTAAQKRKFGRAYNWFFIHFIGVGLNFFGSDAANAVSSSLPGRPVGAPWSGVTEQKWRALVAITRETRDMATNTHTIVEDLEKKVKRLVAITLREDFQRDYPWDPEAKKSDAPEDAAARAAATAARIRAQKAKRDNQGK